MILSIKYCSVYVINYFQLLTFWKIINDNTSIPFCFLQMAFNSFQKQWPLDCCPDTLQWKTLWYPSGDREGIRLAERKMETLEVFGNGSSGRNTVCSICWMCAAQLLSIGWWRRHWIVFWWWHRWWWFEQWWSTWPAFAPGCCKKKYDGPIFEQHLI